MKLSSLLAIYASVVLSGLGLFPPLALAQTAPQVPSYESAWNPDFEQFPAGNLVISTTYNYAIAMGHAGIITSFRTAAVTPPSATGDVTVQFFKNNLTTPMTAVYDLNGASAGVAATIPIPTANNANCLLGQNDIIICQYITGAALGGAVGVTATAVAKVVTYSNGTSF